MMQEHIFFQQNPGVVPLIRLHLHDHHITRLWWTIKLTEPAFIPAVLIKIVRILLFPPRIIDAVIVQLDAVGLPKIAHHQAPAIVVAQHEWSLEERQLTTRVDGTEIAFWPADNMPGKKGRVALRFIQFARLGGGIRMAVNNTGDRSPFLNLRIILRRQHKIIFRLCGQVPAGEITLRSAPLGDEAAGLARIFCRRMFLDGLNRFLTHISS
ncbi:Uncharacterised protein [Klebsiella pneumoniae]|nr:Uncharacterised protein [Klebsiella pneumoniae]